MEQKESYINKSIYENSLIKVKDIIFVLVGMLLVIPLMLKQGDKTISSFHLILLTSLIILLIMLGDHILRKYTYKKLKKYNFKESSNKYPTFMKVIVVIFLVVGLFLVYKGAGLFGLGLVAAITLVMQATKPIYRFIYINILPIRFPKLKQEKFVESSNLFVTCLLVAVLIVLVMAYGVIAVLALCALGILLKIALAFSPMLLIGYLTTFRFNFYKYFREKELDFKFKYGVHQLEGIMYLALPILITFVLSDVDTLFCITSFLTLNSDTVFKIAIVIALIILAFMMIKKFELNAIKTHDNWELYLNEYSKKSGILGLVFSLTILLIFISTDLGGFG